mgnify:CR=1 FL=1
MSYYLNNSIGTTDNQPRGKADPVEPVERTDQTGLCNSPSRTLFG